MLPHHRLLRTLPLLVLLSACASTTDKGETGVQRKQLLLLPSAQVDAMALESYKGELGKASTAGKLNTDKVNLERIRVIADRLIPHVAIFRKDALDWQWEVNLETRDELNAYCAPGGKIMFFTGIINQLRLTDAEIAAIMGHEIAHALREHGRERMSQAYVQQTGMSLLAGLGKVKEENIALAQMAVQLGLTLPHSRGQEAEADIVGLELMARAGYDPAAAVTLWQKMGQASGGGGGPAFMSTHPSSDQRISGIQGLLPKVNPLYVVGKPTLSRAVPRVVPRT
ncbi:MAG: M48 family metallopeptidase [Moraxellaceae bacterium]|nr:M48 family metallopeptidase [Moraxellaceae bacterium]